jgi:hypothetical protein
MSSSKKSRSIPAADPWVRLPIDPTGVTWTVSLLVMTALEGLLWLEVESALAGSVIGARGEGERLERSKRLAAAEREGEILAESLRSLAYLYGAGVC